MHNFTFIFILFDKITFKSVWVGWQAFWNIFVEFLVHSSGLNLFTWIIFSLCFEWIDFTQKQFRCQQRNLIMKHEFRINKLDRWERSNGDSLSTGHYSCFVFCVFDSPPFFHNLTFWLSTHWTGCVLVSPRRTLHTLWYQVKTMLKIRCPFEMTRSLFNTPHTAEKSHEIIYRGIMIIRASLILPEREDWVKNLHFHLAVSARL